GGRRDGVGLVVDDDEAVVVAVEQVDEAFEDTVADQGADIGLPPVRPLRGSADGVGVEGGAGELGDDVGVLGDAFGQRLAGDGVGQAAPGGEVDGLQDAVDGAAD